MNMIQRSEKIHRASELIKHGLQSRLIANDTGLSIHSVRSLYKELEQDFPDIRQNKEAKTILTSKWRILDASLLVNLYVQLTKVDNIHHLDVNVLMDAHKLYQRLRMSIRLPQINSQNEISLNEAWLLVSEIKKENATLKNCRCGCRYLFIYDQKVSPKCPLCSLSKIS
ncbi:hypothetical protein D5018_20910 [Parashewanella curva]|uniref:Uncharacterized protein n=1 Tax=Parashewanella curva TaxID=2338552 RepID=A0A3L8PTL4_9GAMM|nr:FlhC family transcriptional regulator [Parashewanella curva]RLV57748.1 hypothetical protein D5018_20910 [Parashewanella curva]